MRRLLLLVPPGALLLGLLPLWLSDARTAELARVGAYTIAIAGLGLLARQAGRLSFGHGAFMAAGGYTTALLATREGLATVWVLPAAAAAGAVAGVTVALTVVRLPGRYFAVPTLGLAIALPRVLAGYAPVSLPVHESPLAAYALAWPLAGAVLYLARALARHRVDRALPVLGTVALSAGLAGLAGGLVVLGLGVASATTFPLRLSLLLAAAAAIGLYGAFAGAVLGGLALQYLPGLVSLERPGRGPAIFAFGLALVLLMLASPLVAALGRARARRRAFR